MRLTRLRPACWWKVPGLKRATRLPKPPEKKLTSTGSQSNRRMRARAGRAEHVHSRTETYEPGAKQRVRVRLEQVQVPWKIERNLQEIHEPAPGVVSCNVPNPDRSSWLPRSSGSPIRSVEETNKRWVERQRDVIGAEGGRGAKVETGDRERYVEGAADMCCWLVISTMERIGAAMAFEGRNAIVVDPQARIPGGFIRVYLGQESVNEQIQDY